MCALWSRCRGSEADESGLAVNHDANVASMLGSSILSQGQDLAITADNSL